ncbi:MarR family transcriptional regulator [Planococcus sp. CPCC 101016]|uniref:MarR family transcriptional regulator n=1 Tax=Planococcus sp. CPCC 101016 TaxID=2599617 RepID=UPI0011B4EA67|nr:helix-turn-helix domain-containing protein [Planococcus sp. CPCC 101016]TWT07960.1 MarR family transcriptional regulator [Planococcus sp. CPCC 101016]
MAQYLPSIEKTIKKEARNCFNKEKEVTAKNGDLFIAYFFRNCTSEGVLFKTIKEITSEMKISHQGLVAILKTLETQQIIYRRNGIIGLRK